MTEGDTSLRQLASTLVAEAEQQQLLRQLQKAQKLNGELTTDLEGARRRLSRLRYERKYHHYIIRISLIIAYYWIECMKGRWPA